MTLSAALVSKISVKIMECLEVDRKERLEEKRDDPDTFNSFSDTSKVTLRNETSNCKCVFCYTKQFHFYLINVLGDLFH